MGDLKAGGGEKATAASAVAVVAAVVSQDLALKPVDTDGDGINDLVEKHYRLNPALNDTDGDGKKDGDEGVVEDSDGDGIINALESALDDSDLDGVVDELDSDNTNPKNDSDGDSYGNGVEKAEGTNPLDAKSFPIFDSDQDGIKDKEEKKAGLDPANPDTDGDGKKDGDEGLTADQDGDGIIDALESSAVDTDQDGVIDEFDSENTNPDNDTDGDGYGNGLESAEGSNPLDARSKPDDRDNDGIPDSIDADKEPIAFIITKEGEHVSLKGFFADVLQIQTLKSVLDNGQVAYENGVIMQDKYLEDKGVIEATKKLVPSFLSSYKNGKIEFREGTLSVSGEVASNADKVAMDTLLVESAGLIHYINDTRVVELPKPKPEPEVQPQTEEAPASNLTPKAVEEKQPIVFEIKKEGSLFGLAGTFTNMEQIAALQNSLDDEGARYTNGTLQQNEALEGDRVIELTQKLIPHFAGQYQKGAIAYRKDLLIVSGDVFSQNDKNMMERLLAANAMGISYRNDTVVVKAAEISDQERQAFADEIKAILSNAQITFKTASAKLTTEGSDVVKQVGDILLKHAAVRVEIAGHTDSDGNDEANMKLSQGRVETVKKALGKQGIDPFRMRVKGYGESQPLVPNDSAQNKAKNRRVEFKIIGE
jgi:outer membrane protein OmpA-like peptidoglycan-associated protein